MTIESELDTDPSLLTEDGKRVHRICEAWLKYMAAMRPETRNNFLRTFQEEFPALLRMLCRGDFNGR